MESEADFGDGLLSSEVGHRRRSTSFSDDYSVQKTNDDATESKFVAVQVCFLQWIVGWISSNFSPLFYCFVKFSKNIILTTLLERLFILLNIEIRKLCVVIGLVQQQLHRLFHSLLRFLGLFLFYFNKYFSLLDLLPK